MVKFTSEIEFDRAAEALGIVIGTWGWLADAEAKLGARRPMGPNKHASKNCKSGGHDYCTCDTCF